MNPPFWGNSPGNFTEKWHRQAPGLVRGHAGGASAGRGAGLGTALRGGAPGGFHKSMVNIWLMMVNLWLIYG